MSQISSSIWQDIAHLWLDLSLKSMEHPDAITADLKDKLLERLHSDLTWFSIIETHPHKRTSTTICNYRNTENTSQLSEFERKIEETFSASLSDPKFYLTDTLSSRYLDSINTTQAFRPQDLMTDEEWEASMSYQRSQEIGIMHSLAGNIVIQPNLAVFIGLHRVHDTQSYTDAERALLGAILPGLKPSFSRYLMSRGMLAPDQPLTPRERETFLLLLQGTSEKEIAQQMGLTHRSLHQYVLSIYRKLHVNSRPELMARWIQGE